MTFKKYFKVGIGTIHLFFNLLERCRQGKPHWKH